MDIFGFAMEKEEEAEKLYRELASRAKEEGVKKILLMLADDEVKHFNTVKSMKEENPEMADTHVLEDAKDVFRSMAEERKNLDANMSEIELYKKAQEWEKQSEEMYIDMAEKSDDEKQKALFERLAKEEHKHYIMDKLLGPV